MIDGFGNAQAHFTDQTPGDAVGLVAEGFNRFKQAAHREQQLLALGCDAETALATAAQPIAETGFQLGHLLADARLAKPQFALRSTEPTALDHPHEQAQQLQIDIMKLSKHHITPR